LEQWLYDTDHAIFEGAQGVLLDEDRGFHPYTTWSRCTATNALELIKEMSPDSGVWQIGVMRSYVARHGPGPLPTETDSLTALIAEHNKNNDWQGMVRYGWFDAVLAGYAQHVTGKLDSLMVTHLDVLPRLKEWSYCVGYKNCPGLYDSAAGSTFSGDMLTKLRLPAFLSLDQRTRVTEAVSGVFPVLESCEAQEEIVVQCIESLLEQQVGMISRGPSSANVELLNSLPF
jgi:adenylosuccinate synthase